eukprot:gnl/MRDRNA2_/MRDRNA2_81000_c0_seq1.p1 gnl/MRDRNA2_/MRDRNA2_81000_c0~~gnl/MRDRNA2_/MRDRNA2_81000_c0_seq1.p1  ORF type:complete len:1018 (+),score=147.53 gnl/MRDRNA2_/MRDRNA2_81000_c0_seq1:50-3103(+)
MPESLDSRSEDDESSRSAKRLRSTEQLDSSINPMCWPKILEQCTPGIASLRVTSTRAFEDEGAGVSWGTAFVIDAQGGILLTARHVVGLGPIRAVAIFHRDEEVDIEVVYRDPLHDFALLKFDVSDVHLTQLHEIPLKPQNLVVNTEIRVVGNDDGEKLQILAGTIARTDRNPPEYGDGPGDENTFYAGCGSNTSGGSSGSPVLDSTGAAVALLAGGGTNSAADFFLPLDRVPRVLEGVQSNQAVPRGTIRTPFLFRPWDRLQRIGITPDIRKGILSDAGGESLKGLLVAENGTSAGAPGEKDIQPGDVLIKARVTPVGQTCSGDWSLCTSFVMLEATLDESVGGQVELFLFRAGVEVTTKKIPIENLFTLMPSEFLECSGGIFHSLSYNHARRMHLEQEGCGVVCAEAGFIFGPKVTDQGIITTVAQKPVSNVETLVEALRGLPDGKYFEVRTLQKSASGVRKKALSLKMQCAYGSMMIWREERTPNRAIVWSKSVIPYIHPPKDANTSGNFGCVNAEGTVDAVDFRPVLGRVDFRVPCDYATDVILDRAESHGMKTVVRRGVGFLVAPGWLLTDRHAVPQMLGDVEVTFDQELTVQATVAFLHPEHNLVLLALEPDKHIPECRNMRLSTQRPKAGDTLRFVGLDAAGQAVNRDWIVGSVAMSSVTSSSSLHFTERNMELFNPAEPMPAKWSGVLLDCSGSIVAFYALFAQWSAKARCAHASPGAIPAFSGLIEKVQSYVEALGPSLTSTAERVRAAWDWRADLLGVEFEEVTTAALVREKGFPDSELAPWKEVLERPVVLTIARVDQTGPAEGILQEGDILVKVDGVFHSSAPSGLERIVDSSTPPRPLQLTIFREQQFVDVEIMRRLRNSDSASRLVIWHGALCVETPLQAFRAGLVPPVVAGGVKNDSGKCRGVYVTRICFGSPAQSFEMTHQNWILSLDDIPVQSLDDLITFRPQGENGDGLAMGRQFVRVRTADHFGKENVVALRTDLLFFPIVELRKADDGNWSRHEIQQ